MDIMFQANSKSVHIGMTNEQLFQLGLRKAGFFVRRMLKKMSHDTDVILWLKNPTIQCFNNATTLIVPLQKPATRLEGVCGTSAFLFMKDGRASYGIFQIFGSVTHANMFAHHFRSLAFQKYGNCRCSYPILIPTTGMRLIKYKDTAMCAWSDKHSYVVCVRTENASSVVQWGNGDIPAYLEASLLHVGTKISDVSEYKESDFASMIYSALSNVPGDTRDNRS
ncbi:MAG: hypothetical protein ACRECH_11655 [Nitrososphaerales archaeon]